MIIKRLQKIEMQMMQNLHTLMNSEELKAIFGVDHSSSVTDYQIVNIRQHSRPKRFDPQHLPQLKLGNEKRNERNTLAHYSFEANGRYRLNTFLCSRLFCLYYFSLNC